MNRANDDPSVGRRVAHRRARIIDAALHLVEEKGVQGLIVRDVADRAGISHGNLQYHFRSKDDLVVAILERVADRGVEAMNDAAGAATSRQARLDAILQTNQLRARRPEVAIWRLALSQVDQSPKLALAFRRATARYQTAVADQLAEIVPGLAAERRRHLARIIQAIVDGFTVQLLVEDPHGPEMRALDTEIKAAVAAILGVA